MTESTIKIIVDGQESIQTVNELSKSIDKFSEQLKGVDDGSEEFKKLTAIIENLQKALTELKVDVDSDEAIKNIEVVNESLIQLQTVAEEPTEIQIEGDAAVQSISDIRSQLKAVQDIIATSEFGSAEFVKATETAAELKDQLDDIAEAVNNVKGEPIEQLGSQFAGVKDSVSKLDFKKASEQLTTFNGTIKKLDVGKVVSGFGQFAKTLGTTVVTSIRAVGTAILANPLLLLATIVVGIGAALFVLKDKFKIIQVAIDAATLPIRTLIDGLKTLSDFLGLTSFAADEAAEKQAIANDKTAASSELLTKKIEEDTNRRLAAAKTAGASAEELAKIEEDGANRIIEAQQKILEGREAELVELQRKVDSSEDLTEQEVAAYERLAGAQNAILDQQQKIADITAGLAKQTADANAKAAADEAKELAERRAAAEKYFNNLTKLQEKYLLTEEQRIQKAADAEKASLRGRGEVEVALRAEIQRKADEQIKKIQDDRIARATRASLDLQEAEFRLELLRAEASAKTDEERLAAQQKFNEQSLELTKKRIEEESAAISNSTELSNEEKLAKQTKLNADLLQLQTDFDDKEKEAQQKALKDQSDRVIAAAQDEVEEVQKARQKLVAGFQQRIGILGFRSAIDELRNALQAELQTIADARQTELDQAESDRVNQLISEEDFQKKRAAIIEKYSEQTKASEEETAQTIQDASDQRFANTVDTLQSALDTYLAFSQAAFEREASQLETRQTELDSFAERERERINESTLNEEEKTLALQKLDEDLFNQQQLLDKQSIELQKRQIKRDRNAALVQIALSNAQALAQGLATATSDGAKGGVIAFAISLAAVLGSIALTIASAKRALKDADAAGAGGGSVPSTPGVSPPSSAAPNAQSTAAPTGVNAAQAQQFQGGAVQQVVSVVEIDRVRNSVAVIEQANTIGFN